MRPKRNPDDAVPDHLRVLAEAHKVSLEVIRNHLFKSAKEIEAKGYSPIEIASAYLILAHGVLHNHHPEDKIDEAFDALSFFAKRRVEYAVKQKKQRKSSVVH